MVRIQCRVSRKRYLGSKHVCEYERMSLHVPRKFHNKVKPFLKQDLDMDVATKDRAMWVSYDPQVFYITYKEKRRICGRYSHSYERHLRTFKRLLKDVISKRNKLINLKAF